MADVRDISTARRRLAPAQTKSITDAALVGAAVDGDRAACDALYRRYAAPIGGTVTRLIACRADAEDIVHDSFLKAFRKLPTLREPSAFRGWLFRIAVSEARMFLRKQKVRSAIGFHRVEDASLEELASKGIDGERRAELGHIDSALKKMSADERIAWMLRHVEGFTLEEAAEHCGCSLATIKRRIKSANERIERLVERSR